uniref:transmembrane protein 65 n=1 Tax=Monopterus albus TaxID=43700 RepID=UPI0009B380FF|nr:transmembrane protein 65 [Monopterus albus]
MLALCVRGALRPAVRKFPPGLKRAPAAVLAAPRPGIGRHAPGRRAEQTVCVLLWTLDTKPYQETLESSLPTAAQIRYVLLHNAIPFVGFGFLDNAIMIAAGTQIELSIGVTLGISTMAAAAMGNLVSDLAGLGLAGYVEVLASKLGMQVPDLTPKQADMWQTRLSSHMGKAIGVSIGCILGMFPLLFLDDEKEKEA